MDKCQALEEPDTHRQAAVWRTHVIAAGVHESSRPLRAHLDPGGLDVGQRPLQRQARDRMHQEALVQRRAFPGAPCTAAWWRSPKVACAKPTAYLQAIRKVIAKSMFSWTDLPTVWQAGHGTASRMAHLAMQAIEVKHGLVNCQGLGCSGSSRK